ncbi:hypothetical protein PAXRUDRAFT_96224, partial [Paxillus rubicundulus Ve08.2h10]
FQKVEKPQGFSRQNVLHAVAEFVVCDDQSLAVANNTGFRNTLVAMQPTATQADLPSTHDVSTYIHNMF